MNRIVLSTVSSLWILALGAMACSKNEDAARPSTTTTNAAASPHASESIGSTGQGSIGAAEAKSIFASRCSTCHGTDGKGKGPAAVTFTTKPRDYTDKAWQASVTDEQIKKTILYGGAAVGKSPLMPSSPDLNEKPAVVEALVGIVRGFAK